MSTKNKLKKVILQFYEEKRNFEEFTALVEKAHEELLDDGEIKAVTETIGTFETVVLDNN